MVGLEAHLTKLDSLLRLECDEVKMIGIWGPAGIGKTTIARALFNQLSSNFSFICFMGNLKGSYRSIMGVDDYDSKLCLQNQLLSKILNRRDMRVHHLGAIKEWLQDQRVLIILDDVDDLEKLEILAKEPSWFGPGSRIIVTTEDKKILKAHGIDDIYRVGLPSEEEGVEILCRSALKKNSVRDGFEELAIKVAKFCGNLPLGLAVVGSSLRGESKNEWELQLSKIETSLDRKIEDVLRVGYDKLSKKDQSLFLHIACFFFFNEDVDHVTTMLAHSNLDVGNGLKTLTDKSLVQISMHREIVMHSLLQQLGKQVVVQQSDEPGKRQFLVEPEEIRGVLENETGTGSLIGISFDVSNVCEPSGMFSISRRAFEGMRNLRFLRFYTDPYNFSLLDILGDVTYLPRLSMLDWNYYPGNRLPPTFQPECLVELHMESSSLQKLWEGIQPLPNLRKLNLNCSSNLKEIPNLLNATNLETLTLTCCTSLGELPSSIRDLHKLKVLDASFCTKLRVIPTNINLLSLEEVDMSGCSRLRTFPDISSNIKYFDGRDTMIEDVRPSVIGRWSRLDMLSIGCKSLKRLRHAPLSVTLLNLSNSDLKMIPDCIIGLPHLIYLYVDNCSKLVSISGHSPSLEFLMAKNCVSLKNVCCSFHKPTMQLMFYNCLELDEESRRRITQQSFHEYICLPGKEIPAEFTDKATRNSITIPLAPVSERIISASSRFKACLLLPPNTDFNLLAITCRLISKGGVPVNTISKYPRGSIPFPPSLSEHLFILVGDLFHQQDRCDEVEQNMNEILFEFSSHQGERIIECGVRILREEAESSSSSSSSQVNYLGTGGNNNHHANGEAYNVSQIENIESSKYTSTRWSWLKNLSSCLWFLHWD